MQLKLKVPTPRRTIAAVTSALVLGLFAFWFTRPAASEDDVTSTPVPDSAVIADSVTRADSVLGVPVDSTARTSTTPAARFDRLQGRRGSGVRDTHGVAG